jgi:hypothetical protein
LIQARLVPIFLSTQVHWRGKTDHDNYGVASTALLLSCCSRHSKSVSVVVCIKFTGHVAYECTVSGSCCEEQVAKQGHNVVWCDHTYTY